MQTLTEFLNNVIGVSPNEELTYVVSATIVIVVISSVFRLLRALFT